MESKQEEQPANLRVGSWRRVSISMALMERASQKLEAGIAHLRRSESGLARSRKKPSSRARKTM